MELASMPWWASLYLGILFSFSVVGIFDDLRHNPLAALISVISLGFAFLFVFAFFDADLTHKLGFFAFPMLIFGVAWEFLMSVKETSIAAKELEKERDLSDEERSLLLNAAIVMNGFVIVPAYVAGLLICFRLVI